MSDVRERTLAVVQGNPGAVETLIALKRTFNASEYGAMVEYLYERGPRGPRLSDRFTGPCKSDALVLGRDLLALASEQRGWE
jgi:hypothetical protein